MMSFGCRAWTFGVKGLLKMSRAQRLKQFWHRAEDLECWAYGLGWFSGRKVKHCHYRVRLNFGLEV